MPKRYRTIAAKPGELRSYYGKADRWSGPEVCYSWGAGTSDADAWFLHYIFTTKFDGEFGSFLDELASRGYDITTLRFSVKRKVT